jgi:hypothetical protein
VIMAARCALSFYLLSFIVWGTIQKAEAAVVATFVTKTHDLSLIAREVIDCPTNEIEVTSHLNWNALNKGCEFFWPFKIKGGTVKGRGKTATHKDW